MGIQVAVPFLRKGMDRTARRCQDLPQSSAAERLASLVKEL